MTRAGAREDQQTVAVVVVHGIGNQLPMDTVRALVDNVFGDQSGLVKRAAVYSRLDRDADFLDLRRLMLTQTDDHPRADFYELYWQPTFGSGSPGAVLGWVWRLLRRKPIGRQMRQVVATARIALGLMLLVVLGATAAVVTFGPQDGWTRYVVPVIPALAAFAALPKLLVRNLLSTVIADASRWFAPSPTDIEGRDKVRQLGLNLLTELHRHGNDDKPRYGRIIVVGHSLGAVVAYDAIRLAFDKLRDPDNHMDAAAGPLAQRQPHAWKFMTAMPGTPPVPGTPPHEPLDGQAYHRIQSQLHAEQRSLEVSWRVTDFISVGTPLTHAPDLLSTKHVDFKRRVEENEFPSCPPQGERQHREERWAQAGKPVPLAAGKNGDGRIAFYRKLEQGPLRAHEASPFATTRWTNLYIPMKWWLGGDPVGGPLQQVFGRGVHDVAVEISAPEKTRRRAMAKPVAAHTLYWQRVSPGHEDPEKDCVVRFRNAMDLRWSD